MFEIPVRPVRIAFDHWELHEVYEASIRTAVSHGHTNLSNYVLYNFKDKPVELYRRLKLNVDLCDELGVSIYSFPMKYHPIEDPDYFSNRDYIGIHWNRKFIRTIQAVLNSTKGKVGKGHSFFCKAFGSNEEEFFKGATDYVAMNGGTVAKMIKIPRSSNGKEYFKEERKFYSGAEKFTGLVRLLRIGLFRIMIKHKFPGRETEGDRLEFREPATVFIHAEGEAKKIEGVKEIKISKLEKPIKVILGEKNERE